MHDPLGIPASSPASETTAIVSEERLRFRRRLKRVSVMVILIVLAGHLMVGLGAAFFVVARYFAKPKAQFVATRQIEMQPEARKHRQQMEKLESMRPRPTLNNRIQSLRPTTLALPSLPKVPVDATIPFDTSAIVNAQVSGIGLTGTGLGSGTGFFGDSGQAGVGMLEGILYDLKQTRAGKDTKMNPSIYDKVVRDFAGKGKSVLKSYYSAPTKLYLPVVAIPVILADKAPAAFKVENRVKPKMWLAIYQGQVTAPDTGKFRFLGHADDVILVWINKQLVLDGGIHDYSKLGKQAGVPFDVQKGATYDIMIAIGESPGGQFHAWLQIQKTDDNSQPYWFRTTSAPTRDVMKDSLPYHQPYQSPPKSQIDGPVWTAVPPKGLSPMGGF